MAVAVWYGRAIFEEEAVEVLRQGPDRGFTKWVPGRVLEAPDGIGTQILGGTGGSGGGGGGGGSSGSGSSSSSGRAVKVDASSVAPPPTPTSSAPRA